MPTITLIREPAAVLVDPDANVDRQPDWEARQGAMRLPSRVCSGLPMSSRGLATTSTG